MKREARDSGTEQSQFWPSHKKFVLRTYPAAATVRGGSLTYQLGALCAYALAWLLASSRRTQCIEPTIRNLPEAGTFMTFHRTSFLRILAAHVLLSTSATVALAECPVQISAVGSFEALLNKAHEFWEQGCRAAVRDLGEILFHRATADHGPSSVQVADALDLLTESHFWLGERGEQEIRWAQRALRIREKAPTRNRSALAQSHLNLGALLHAKLSEPSHPQRVFDHYQRARTLWGEELGYESDEVANILSWFVELIEDWGDDGTREAVQVPWIAEILNLETTTGSSIAAAAKFLGISEAVAEIVSADPALAIALRTVSITKSRAETPVFANSLNIVGKVLDQRQLYDEALKVFTATLNARQDAHPPEHPEIARAHHNKGQALLLTGKFDEARRELETGYRIRLEATGDRFRGVISTSLNLLAKLSFLTGDLQAAVGYYNEALPRLEKTHEDFYHVEGLVGLAETYEELKENQKAESYYTKAIATLKRNEGSGPITKAKPTNLKIAAVQTRLGTLLARTGNTERGEDLLSRALERLESLVSRPPLEISKTLRGVAEIAIAKGDQSKALSFLEQSVDILSTYEGDHPALIDLKLIKAATELELGTTTEARTTLDQAAKLLPGLGDYAYGINARYLTLRARLGVATGKRHEALTDAAQAAYLYARHLAPAFRVLPKDSALQFALENRSTLELALSLLASPSAAEGAAELVWPAIAYARGLVVHELEASNNWAKKDLPKTVRKLVTNLSEARRALAQVQTRYRPFSTQDERRIALQFAFARVAAAESSLAAETALARLDSPSEDFSLERLFKELPPRNALVAFVRFTGSVSSKNAEQYGAFVKAKESSRARFLNLGSATEIDRVILDWRSFLLNFDEYSGSAAENLRKTGLLLKKLLWEPISGSLGTSKRVLIVPDGAIYLLPFAALPGQNDDTYLIEDGFEFHRLVSERDITRSPSIESSKQSLAPPSFLTLGGPAFGKPTSQEGTRLASVPSPFKRWRDTLGRYYQDVLRGSCRPQGQISFLSLPQTSLEAKEIDSILQMAAYRQGVIGTTELFIGEAATEAAFKKSAPGKSIIHLATHAFADLDCQESIESRGMGDLLLGSPETRRFIPGIAFAGANRSGTSESADEDGILTLPEIASIDLSGTDWVVLSACESALGQVALGEGIQGLAQGFRASGVRTVIHSLWTVLDEVTREWMNELYRARILESKNTPASLRSANLEIIRRLRREQGSAHPYFWAAFVATGAWS